jgi:hypothetical protein
MEFIKLKERNALHTIQRKNANWIGHMLRKNCLLKHVIEGKVEGYGEARKKTEVATG